MALDAAMLSYTAQELDRALAGARVDKIYMPARDEAVFALRTQTDSFRLFISARPGASRIHITREEFDNPAVPPGFCMLLRKYLGTARVAAIHAAPGERILFVDFDATSELGDRVRLTLSVESMGRYSNIVLVGEGRVIDALKRIDFDHSDVRQLLPGVPFTMPPAQAGKLSFAEADDAAILAAVQKKQKPLSAALLDSIAGLCPAVCREIARRTDPADPDADRLTPAQAAALRAVLAQVRGAAAGEGEYLSIVYDGKKPVEFSFIELTQYAGLTSVRFDTASSLLDAYYLERDRAERARTRSSDLQKQVGSLYDRAVRKLAARRQELLDTGRAEEKRLYGELLTANLHAVGKGMPSVRLLNYYTGETVDVPLDTAKTPNENAQKYYKEYRKLTTAAKMLASLIEQGEQEIEYLASVKYEITEARSEEDFLLIRRELKDAGYLRGFKYKEQKKQRRTGEYALYRTSDGCAVRAGRNNAANEKLTLRLADKRDIWFHVKDASGSHVVLQTDGREPSALAYTQAAMIAAYHSALRGGERVAVDYAPVKNVKKAVGQRTGMVYYENYSTAYVTPDEKTVEALAEK
ncbi:MAG: NFACT RNA binding domain-containing protein [Oscillospiraceae bacterium]|nr:NFACT RNA binding domain-containing protein [Oscillospiraceae bacterium]